MSERESGFRVWQVGQASLSSSHFLLSLHMLFQRPIAVGNRWIGAVVGTSFFAKYDKVTGQCEAI